MKSKLLFIILFFQVFFGNSQINKINKPYFFDNKIVIPNEYIFEISNFSNEIYLKEDKKNSLEKKYRFAINENVNIKSESFFIKDIESQKVGYYKIIVPNSTGLCLNFSNINFSNGEKLFIFNQNCNYLLEYNLNNRINKKNILQTDFISDDTLIIEYHFSKNLQNTNYFFISSIGIAYRNLKNESQWCEVNINCESDSLLQKIKKSVVKISYQSGAFGSYYLCSGALIANTSLDNTPYLLTANHCISNQDEANSAIFYFNDESPSCSTNIGNESQTISGATLIATADNQLDFSLLQLSIIPPQEFNPYYSGWNREKEYNDISYCIHHPAGDIKKISIEYDTLKIGSFSGYDSNKHWHVRHWESGTTEGGSSGSPIFNSIGQIIGDLSGGDASCDYNYDDYFQQFYHCWNDYNSPEKRLKSWLDTYGFEPIEMQGYDPYKNISLDKPLNFEIILIDSLVTITWDEPHNKPDKYLIYRNLQIIDEVQTPQILYNIITDNGVYAYFATAVYDGQESKPSNIKSVVYGDTTSMPQTTEVRIFPNPALYELSINTPDTIPITKIEIINYLGQNINEYIINTLCYTKINISNLKTGLYFVRIYTKGEMYIRKLIIQN